MKNALRHRAAWRAAGVVLQSGSLVTGDVTAGGSVSSLGTVNGTIAARQASTPLAAPAVAPCGTFSPGAGMSGSFVYSARTGDLAVSGGGSVTLADGTYCLHTITLSGGSSLKVTGPVVLNLTGQLLASGGALVNLTGKPANLRVATSYSGGTGVSLSGGANAYLSVYAPATGVSISGGSPVYGAVLGKTLVSSGNTPLHYDTSLATVWASNLGL